MKNLKPYFKHLTLCRILCFLLVLTLTSSIATGAPPDGTVASEQKISESVGGLGAVLDDADLFGWSAAGIGDLNNDGTEDLAVGVYLDDDGGTDRGAIWILFLNQNGTVMSKQKISSLNGGFNGVLDNLDRFGSSIANLGDLDGDGVTDIAVGAEQDTDGGSTRGAVWILFMNSNGTVKSQQKISATEGNLTGPIGNGERFGDSTTGLGDLDGDGNVDLAVGAPYTGDVTARSGAIWILFLNADGTVKSEQRISTSSGNFTGSLLRDDYFGSSLSTIGDINNDGVVDIAVAAVGDDDGGADRGAIWILRLNTDGTVKTQNKISDDFGGFTGTLVNNDSFGFATAGIGDLDNDGVLDLAVTTDGGVGIGSVWILFLNSDGTVKSHQEISSSVGNFGGMIDENDRFGSALAFMGDLNDDGVGDLAVGASNDDVDGFDHGAIWILNMAGAAPNTPECLAWSQSSLAGIDGFNNGNSTVQFNSNSITVSVEFGLFTSGATVGLASSNIPVEALVSMPGFPTYSAGTFTIPVSTSGTVGTITLERCTAGRWCGQSSTVATVTLQVTNGSIKSTSISLTLLPPSSTCAQVTYATISTGLDEVSNAAYPIGAADSRWQLVSTPTGPLQIPQYLEVVAPQSGWAAPPANSRWLNPVLNSSSGTLGTYTYRSHFCLSGTETRAVRLKLGVLATGRASLFLNNRKLLQTPVNPAATSSPLDTTVILSGGRHSLRVDVENFGDGLAFNLAGSVESAQSDVYDGDNCCRSAYSMGQTSIKCGQEDEQFADSRFYVPLLAESSVNSGVIGVDFCLRYDNALFEPTGRIRLGEVVLDAVEGDQTKAAYVINTLTNPHQVRVGVHYAANAPATAEFNGVGEVLAVEFRVKSGVGAGTVATFSSCELLEAYQTQVVAHSVADGDFELLADNILEGTLQYWDRSSLRETRVIPYNNDPLKMLPTDIYGTDGSCGDLSTSSAQPNLQGEFNYDLVNGSHIVIRRDINGSYHDTEDCTSILPYVNSWDAYWANLIVMQNSSWVPGPFAMIAADVNMDGVVSTNDVTHILNRAVGNICEYPQQWNYADNAAPTPGLLSFDWRFVDATTVNTSPAYLPSSRYPTDDLAGYSRFRVPPIPQCLPVIVSGGDKNCTYVGPEVFSGVLLGDVNGDWDNADGVLLKNGGTDKTAAENTKLVLDIDNPMPLGESRHYRLFVEGYFSELTNAIDLVLEFDDSRVHVTNVRPANAVADANLTMAWNAKDGILAVSAFTFSGVQSEVAVFEIDVTCIADELLRATDFGEMSALLNGRQVTVTDIDNRALDVDALSQITGLDAQPNPASEEVNLQFQLVERTPVWVSLSTLTGGLIKNVLDGEVLIPGAHRLTVDLSGLPSGVYVASVRTSKDAYMHKILVVH